MTVRDIEVHAASGEEALADGCAALGVDPRLARVEILESDEHGVTARVFIPDADEAAEPEADEVEEARPRDEEDEEDGSEPEPGSSRAARAHLRAVLELMGVDAHVEIVEEDEDEVQLNVEGHDLGVVIGSYGQTLNAVQFLVNIVTNRGRGRRRRVVVDAQGYRDRRRRKLERLAEEHARRAKEERRDVIIEGLRASERRIIHTALQHDPDVATFSEGEEPNRRLIISPRT